MRFVVDLEAPANADLEDVRDYVEVAVAAYAGCLAPDDPMLKLDGKSVMVSIAVRKWEYKLVSQRLFRAEASKSANETRGGTDSIEDGLDAFGRDGWELCGIDYGHFIFKRGLLSGK